MLSIQFIREHTERVRRDMLLRNAPVNIDRVLQLDEQRRALLQQVESLRARRNTASKAIGATRDPAEREVRITEMRLVGEEIERLEAKLRAIEEELQQRLYEIPNIVDEAVPKGPDETSNVVVETIGEPRPFDFEPRPHWELGTMVDGLDIDRGAKMSGSRFYVLKGPLARLQRALIQFMLDEHLAAGFTEAYVPYMLNEASLLASGQLPKFRDNLYRDAEEDFYFIPTAEVALVNYYRDEILPPGSLPQRFVAHTPCFRREKMSAGRDVRGIKRGHQFEKVEMFVYCEPDQSPAELELLVSRAKHIAAALELPHRVVALCSGDLGFNAARTFDLEVWAPGQGEWLEVSSASNCLDFQARRANIRYRPAQDAPPRHPHMLNASGLALPRTVIAVMENYQQPDGSIEVPAVLRRYLGADRIAAVRPPASSGR
ncbi:serine--tRNA ligase [Tepidiforma sp.]|uniref:serine--tRNA ligase n=1 Tax=Tepidiforma sp. TaxID=2682230 RepID=UPI002ADDC409|nr:serine--tRNA ligase [Tepidiforma sp.]